VTKSSDPQSVSREPLGAAVTTQLRSMIIHGRLKPGQKINESDLAGSLQVSRTPLREALKTLQEEGLILMELHRRTYVTEITVEQTAEVFEALAALERLCCEISARRMTEAQRSELRALHERMYAFHRERDRARYFELNDQIHRAIVEGSANRRLIDFHAKLISSATRARFAAIHSAGRWDASVAEHQAILAAIEARSADRAGRLLESHVHETGQLICAVLRQNQRRAP